MLPYGDAVQDLMAKLSIERTYREANVISVSFTGTDPVEVAQVPNMVAVVFIAERRSSKKTEATSTVLFLSEQIDAYTDELRIAEEGLLAFQQGEQVVNLEAEGAEQVCRLVDQQGERDRIAGELQSLNDILGEIGRASENPPPGTPSPFRRLAGFPTFLQNQAVTELLSDLKPAGNRADRHGDAAHTEPPRHGVAATLHRSARDTAAPAGAQLSQ